MVLFFGGGLRRNPLANWRSRAKRASLPESSDHRRYLRHMIMIMLQDFMDPWTFNQKNLMKCCKEFLLPGGKQIPFCAYNTIGYREQARAQLEAAEPERVLARKEGRAFVPWPITFEFKKGTENHNGHTLLKSLVNDVSAAI